jgi:GNAT superfamily N-acetyltransferase
VPQIHYCLLPALEQPLLNKFYKSQGSSMRAAPGGQHWVARAPQLIAALNLTAVPGGSWLTGLLVGTEWRAQGIARGLIETATRQEEGSVWLFCHPDLQAFYARLGFASAHTLPAPLADRLVRYQRSKALLAMVQPQSS